jgi:hypothetical protein
MLMDRRIFYTDTGFSIDSRFEARFFIADAERREIDGAMRAVGRQPQAQVYALH